MVWVLGVSLQTSLPCPSHWASASSTRLSNAQSRGGEGSKRWTRDLGPVLGDWSSLGCEAGLTLCFASPGEMTNSASRMAGCATWRQRSSASCPPTQRRTSSPSLSTQMSLHSGRWPTLTLESTQPGRGTFPKPFCYGSWKRQGHLSAGAMVVRFLGEFGGIQVGCSRGMTLANLHAWFLTM